LTELTKLLRAAGTGDKSAAADLFSLVYSDLRRIAARHLGGTHGQSLQPTALVHEVYLRVFQPGPEGGEQPWQGRKQFFAAAAVGMRRILIDAARRKGRQKRGGNLAREPLDPDQVAAPEVAEDLLALDAALTAFAAVEPSIAELVTLR